MIWVLVDVSYLAYRALHSVGDLSHDDVPTGIVFGFLQQLREICFDDRIRSNKVAIFAESRRSIRAEGYPEYKQKRRAERTDEEIERIRTMRRQLNELTSKVLPEIGFPVFKQDGLESDDVLAAAADSLTATKTPERLGVMITSDGDLYQCISNKVHWYDPMRRLYYDVPSFKAAKGIPPFDWAEVKAIGGCKTDNVEGVKGVAEETAIKYIKGDLPIHHKTHARIISPEGRATIKRNRGLVTLPHRATEYINLPSHVEYNADAFFRHCERFGLKSVFRERDAWEQFLSGDLFRTRKRGEVPR